MENAEVGMQTVELDGCPSSVSRLLKLDKLVYKLRLALNQSIINLLRGQVLWTTMNAK